MFTKARLKLTTYYTLIIAIIIIIFSGVLFHLTNEHIRENFNYDNLHEHDPAYERLVENSIGDLGKNIILSDFIVIIISAFFNYFLAGKTLDPISKALEAQEQFSANASHELRTPLSILKTQFEVFLKKKDAASQNATKLAQSSLEEIDRMIGMTENLLMLARSKNKDVVLETKAFNLSHSIREILSHFEMIAESKGVQLIVHQPDNLEINTNEKLFNEVLFNLMQNAVNYTDKGKIIINVKPKNFLVITIEDTGIGISKEDLTHIFEPFYKADASRAVSSGSVGLGLSIVNEIIGKLEGSIKIESDISKGTLVTLTFPKIASILS